jgi:molybdate transport system substrate-binding protein
MMRIKKALSIGAMCFFSLQAAWAAEAPPIAAASDLKFALTEVARKFKKDTGQEVRLSFGSSGVFKTQLENGAPYQLFLSADENYIFSLRDKGLTKDGGMLYAIGRIALFLPHKAGLIADGELSSLRTMLADGRVKRFAVANPAHAPYGRAARAALEHAGLWSAIEPKLVLGENASQAMQFAGSGSAQGGIVPLSLSRSPEVARLGTFAIIPAAWHSSEPLKQRMVLLRNAGSVAEEFYRYLQKPAARDILSQYGFARPEEAVQ